MSGFVYAVACCNRVKIGFSEQPEARFSKIASDAPFPCELTGFWEGSLADEAAAHVQFGRVRTHGEWFALTVELRDYIRQKIAPISLPQLDAPANVFTALLSSGPGMEPAKKIVTELGGPNAVAQIAGVHRTRVSNWMRPKDVGGTGGTIPFKHVPALIEAAKNKGISLCADDFLPVEQPPQPEKEGVA